MFTHTSYGSNRGGEKKAHDEVQQVLFRIQHKHILQIYNRPWSHIVHNFIIS